MPKVFIIVAGVHLPSILTMTTSATITTALYITLTPGHTLSSP